MPLEPTDAVGGEAKDIERRRQNSRVFRSTATYMVVQLLTWTATLLTIRTIPRALGENAMGQAALSSVMVLPAGYGLMFAIESYVTKEVGRDPGEASRLLRALLGLRLLLVIPATLLGLASLFFSLWLIHHHSLRGVWNDPATRTLGVLAFVQLAQVPVAFLTQPFGAVMVGMERARDYAVIPFLQQVFPLFALPFLAHGPIALVGAALFAWILTGIYSVIWGWRTLPIRPSFDPPLWRRLVRRGAPFMVNSYSLLFYSLGTTTALKQFGGDAAIGVYGQASRLAGFAQAIPAVLAPALLPMIARFADNSPVEFRQLQVRVIGLLIAVGLPITILFCGLAHPASQLIYGTKEFGDVPLALQLCALNIVPLYLVTILYQFLVAQDRAGIWTWFLLGTVLLNWVLCLASVPWAGRVLHNPSAGAAIASLGAEFSTMLGALIALRIRLFSRELAGRGARAALAGGAMIGAMWLTRHLFLVVPALVGIGAYIAMAWLLHLLTDDERALILQRLRDKLPRRRSA